MHSHLSTLQSIALQRRRNRDPLFHGAIGLVSAFCEVCLTAISCSVYVQAAIAGRHADLLQPLHDFLEGGLQLLGDCPLHGCQLHQCAVFLHIDPKLFNGWTYNKRVQTCCCSELGVA